MSHHIHKARYIILGLIVAFAFFLRTYLIQSNPPSLSWDEVSIGYNAFSILKTGKDEHGKFLPLDTFVAYGDYKPPLAIYLTVPSVALFGLNEFAVRFPSAVAGTLLVAVTYFLVMELLPDYTLIALLTSLLMAISPWHIQLSRAGFEANIAVLLVNVGALWILKARKNPKYWLITFLPFVGAIYTFNSARYFSPFFVVGLFVMTWSTLKKQFRWIVVGMFLAMIFMIPIVPHLISKDARLRFDEVNIFTDPSVVAISNARAASDGNTWWAKTLDNRRIGYARSYLVHFFDNLQPDFLFIKGDGNPKFSIQDVGQLYLIEFPLLIFGLYFVFMNYPVIGLFLLYWIGMAIVPAAVARETPHALRIENSLPAWQIFIAGGIFFAVTYFKRPVVQKCIILSVIMLYVLSFTYYIHNYYTHYPIQYSGEWQYGYREAIRYIQPIKKNYSAVYMTDSIGRPYMYALFYERYDPNTYLRTVKGSFDWAGFYNVTGFDVYHFVRGSAAPIDHHGLYIMSPGTAPANARILTTINNLDGTPTLIIYDL